MPDHKQTIEDVAVTRREFLSRCGMGFGGLGLTMMMSESGLLIPLPKAGAEEAASLAPRLAPLPAKAKPPDETPHEIPATPPPPVRGASARLRLHFRR